MKFFRNPLIALAVFLTSCASTNLEPRLSSRLFEDSSRQRLIPTTISAPKRNCAKPLCPVAFVSAGYNVNAESYSYIGNLLNSLGYLVVYINHQLPSDPPLPTSGDLHKLRAPFWDSGAENILFVTDLLSKQYPTYDWSSITLVGHSQGGDISAWFAQKHPEHTGLVISLDHRRVALPAREKISTLTIRATEHTPDPGAIANKPSANYCISYLANDVKHNDLYDGGPDATKARILEIINGFLDNKKCLAGT